SSQNPGCNRDHNVYLTIFFGRRRKEVANKRQTSENWQPLPSIRLHFSRNAGEHHGSIVLDARGAIQSSLSESRRQTVSAAHILRLNLHLHLHIEIRENDGREIKSQSRRLVIDDRKTTGRETVGIGCIGSGLHAERISLGGLYGHALTDTRTRLFVIERVNLG